MNFGTIKFLPARDLWAAVCAVAFSLGKNAYFRMKFVYSAYFLWVLYYVICIVVYAWW
jgi:hypothetical protein